MLYFHRIQYVHCNLCLIYDVIFVYEFGLFFNAKNQLVWLLVKILGVVLCLRSDVHYNNVHEPINCFN